ncbi:hypothetical protein GV828_03015 [Flavobacterium sp. NST-5]|uniref:Alpha-amylase n=1 Tax=Flavobacterium ichthyis TaxID=2698827 RepID=A0ABW9ZBK3_9FLAO|nr:hypothetical protein [Flavobacterium ichthyis]NBL64168.1 hypothetical protein [Flavobacterium ichthyis]
MEDKKQHRNQQSGKTDKSGKYVNVNNLPNIDLENHAPKSEGGKMPEKETKNLKNNSEQDKQQGNDTIGIP